MEVFIDESGDLGFSSKSTKFFVVAYVVPKESWIIRTQIGRILKRLHRRRKYTGYELKFSNSSHNVRLNVLNKLRKFDWEAGIIVLEKGKVKNDLKRNITILYNYTIVHHVMRKLLLRLEPHESLKIYIDRSLPRSSREAFDDYVRRKAEWVWNVELERHPPLSTDKIKVFHESSERERCLQLADYIAGAAFQKYERGREEYLRLVEDKITDFIYLW